MASYSTSFTTATTFATWSSSSNFCRDIMRNGSIGNSFVYRNRGMIQFKTQRLQIKSSLDSNVSDMRNNVSAPKGLFPPEPEHYRGPKLKVAIIGAGLAGMSTAVELLDQGHEVGADQNLLVKDHTHTFVNKGGQIGVSAPLYGINAFLTTQQLKPYDKARNALALAMSPVVRALIDPDGALQDICNLDSISFSKWFVSKDGMRKSIQRMWDHVAYALGFIDCDNMSACCMLTVFALFATKIEASLLCMLKGSPDLYLSGLIRKYIMDKGGRFHRGGDTETYFMIKLSMTTLMFLDLPCLRLLPSEWRESEFFNTIYKLVKSTSCNSTTAISWVGYRVKIPRKVKLKEAVVLDNLLYSPDADFSCFADPALTSPEDYYIEGHNSLLQCVLTPGDPYMPLTNDKIIERVVKQVLTLFPSALGLEVIWSSVVKISQSLYGEGPGVDPFRPDQKTPVKNFFLVGSYTKHDYIDSMEGTTLSGREAAAYICNGGEDFFALRKQISEIEAQSDNISGELSFV